MKRLVTLILSFLGVPALFGSHASAMSVEPSTADAAPLKTAHQTYWFIKLDGRWYDVAPPSGVGLFISLSIIGARAYTARMSNCRRANGMPLDYTPAMPFWYGPAQYPLYQIEYPIRYNFQDPTGAGILYLDIKTIPGDVICNGEVPDPVGEIPPIEPPEPEPHRRIFSDGFEEYRLFCNGFEPQFNIKCNPGN